MKKIYTLTALALALLGQAQDFKGMATYFSKTSTEDMRMEDNNQIPEAMRKMIEERIKKMSEKTFTLYFDKNQSVYEEEEVIQAGNDPFGEGFKMMSSAMYGGIFYKDIKSGFFMQERDMFGKEFLIKDSLKVFNWELGTETKQIGDYLCFKATAKVPFDTTDFKNMRRKEVDEKDKDKEPSTNFLDQIEIPSEVIVTAWYTPQVPVSNGPAEFWGLPGLIMEVSSGKTTVLCSKLVINPKEKKEIKAPKKGKVVTQAEFQKMFMQKMEEFQQMGRGQRGGRAHGF